MSNQILISNYRQLLDFIEEQELSSSEICEIIQLSLNVFADENKKPEELKKELENFISKYCKRPGEKPLFLD